MSQELGLWNQCKTESLVNSLQVASPSDTLVVLAYDLVPVTVTQGFGINFQKAGGKGARMVIDVE